MTIRQKLIVGALLVAAPVAVVAQNWPVNRHPYLQRARFSIDSAFMDLRSANNGPRGFGGHRARAMELLRQAQFEISLAARYADTGR